MVIPPCNVNSKDEKSVTVQYPVTVNSYVLSQLRKSYFKICEESHMCYDRLHQSIGLKER